jgi:hypothetical protein
MSYLHKSLSEIREKAYDIATQPYNLLANTKESEWESERAITDIRLLLTETTLFKKKLLQYEWTHNDRNLKSAKHAYHKTRQYLISVIHYMINPEAPDVPTPYEEYIPSL